MPANDVNSRLDLFTKDDIDKHPVFDAEGDEKRLFQAFREDSLIIFYGAGVSRLAQCASWVGLACHIACRFCEAGSFSEQERELLEAMANKDPRKVISICYHRARNEAGTVLLDLYRQAILESVTPGDQTEFERIHGRIVQLNPLVYVTTNIDRGIEGVRRGDQRPPVNLAREPDLTRLPELLRDGNVFYLHGSVDDLDNTIFSVDNYYQLYTREGVNRFLQEIFADQYCVLFVGYSLQEHEILQNIFLAINQGRNSAGVGGIKREKRHYVLSPIYSKDLAEFNINRMFFDIHGVKAIPYFIDFESYGRLHHALSKLAEMKKDMEPRELDVFDEIDKA